MAEHNDNTEGLHFLDYWQVIAARKEIVIAVLLLMVTAGIVVTRSMPRVYRATCEIQVQRETPDIDVGFGRPYGRYDPYFLRTQFELIQSDQVIEEAVRELNLTEVFGRSYGYLERTSPGEAFERTVRLVSSKMRVQQKRDTDLIEISMHFDKPEGEAAVWAARTANTVARVFREQNQRRSREVTERALEVLRREIEDQDRQIAQTETELDSIRETYQITEAGVDDAMLSLNARVLSQAEIDRARAEIDLQRKQVRFDKVASMDESELVGAMPVIGHSEALGRLVADRRNAEIKLSTHLRADLGPQHPDVIRTRALIDELDAKIAEELRAYRMALELDYEVALAAYERINAFVEDLKAQERRQAGSGYRQYRQVAERLRNLRERRRFLDERYITEALSLRIPHTSVEIIQEAKISPNVLPISPNFPMNIMLSVVAGLVSGVALAYFVEYLDTSVKTVEDVERYLKTQVMGVVPQKVRHLNDPNARLTHSEAYRVLRTNVKSSKRLNNGRVVSVTSASVGEGKTQTIFNLAYVSAQLGDRVLLIDADLHRPSIHKVLDMSNNPGLCNVLVGESELDDCIQHTAVPSLDFLPSGKLQGGSVHGLIDTEAMLTLLNTLKARYEWIYLDSPPMIGVSDASQIVRITDAVVMVVQHRKYPRALPRRAKEMIDNLGGNLLGVVLNNINISRDYSSYYYKYHYYYYPYGGKAQS